MFFDNCGHFCQIWSYLPFWTILDHLEPLWRGSKSRFLTFLDIFWPFFHPFLVAPASQLLLERDGPSRSKRNGKKQPAQRSSELDKPAQRSSELDKPSQASQARPSPASRPAIEASWPAAFSRAGRGACPGKGAWPARGKCSQAGAARPASQAKPAKAKAKPSQAKPASQPSQPAKPGLKAIRP